MAPANKIGLTPRQAEALRLFKKLSKKLGHSPSLGDMAGALGVSRVTVFKLIEQLERRGWVRRQPGANNGISLV
jgi:DNA-binding MarR family transcriptional regulator